MRRLIESRSLILFVMLLAVGCNRQRRVAVDTIEEEVQPLASMVHMADPRASLQLLKGFYDVEQNAWRWTMGKFAVSLRPPVGGAEKGGTLVLRLSIPDPVIQRLHSVTLTANAGGASLEPETFAESGEYVYTRDVPASGLAGDAVTVDFALDKFLTAGMVEARELGIIVTSVGLEPK